MKTQAEYYFKALSQGQTEIAKFEGGDLPSATYIVTSHASGRMSCDCPAGSHNRQCKHLDMVRKWKFQQTAEDE